MSLGLTCTCLSSKVVAMSWSSGTMSYGKLLHSCFIVQWLPWLQTFHILELGMLGLTV